MSVNIIAIQIYHKLKGSFKAISVAELTLYDNQSQKLRFTSNQHILNIRLCIKTKLLLSLRATKKRVDCDSMHKKDIIIFRIKNSDGKDYKITKTLKAIGNYLKKCDILYDMNSLPPIETLYGGMQP